jgi:hypothetical protein
MGINKNFVVKKGIEVNENLLYADPNTNKVGIGKTDPSFELDVVGRAQATIVGSTSKLVVDGLLETNGDSGDTGEYLVSTGTGVTWQKTPGLRVLAEFTAEPNQDAFPVTYTPASGVDVFVNGARLSSADYSADDGTSVIFNVPCFGGERVDIISYSVFGTASPGITIQENSVPVGNPLSINTLNFVGFSGIGIMSNGIGVTITTSGVGGTAGVTIQDNSTPVGDTLAIKTLNFVGFGSIVLANGGIGVTINNLRSIKQKRENITAISNVYTINIRDANTFKLVGPISTNVSVNLTGLDWLATDEEWEGKITFQYSAGTISWFPANVGLGYTVKWNGNYQINPTVNETETLFVIAVGGTTALDVAYLQGRV